MKNSVLILLIFLSCCTADSPIQIIQEEIQTNNLSNSTKSIIIVSDTDCPTCLESINPKLKNLQKPIGGIFLISQKKTTITFTNWFEKTKGVIDWHKISNLKLANALNAYWQNEPAPCILELNNGKIIKITKL